MKKRILSLLLSIFLTTTLFAQDWSKAKDPESLATVDEAAQIAKQIVEAAGLKANFMIAEAQVPNAMAVVHMGKRYILYNPQFFKILNRATGTRWAAISVLAHEIGHHLYSPSVNAGKTALATELEADKFSGFVLQKMGATLSEAQAAMKTLGTSYATRTHPGRDDRIGSIAEGWKKAGGIVDAEENTASNTRYDRQQTIQPENIYSENKSSKLPANIAATIHFNATPQTDYYVTTRMNIVKVSADDQVELIARITRSDDRDYPYIIYDDTGYRVYVNAYGEILNSRGKILGKMKVAGRES